MRVNDKDIKDRIGLTGINKSFLNKRGKQLQKDGYVLERNIQTELNDQTIFYSQTFIKLKKNYSKRY